MGIGMFQTSLWKLHEGISSNLNRRCLENTHPSWSHIFWHSTFSNENGQCLLDENVIFLHNWEIYASSFFFKPVIFIYFCSKLKPSPDLSSFLQFCWEMFLILIKDMENFLHLPQKYIEMLLNLACQVTLWNTDNHPGKRWKSFQHQWE